MAEGVFAECNNLKYIKVDSNNKTYESRYDDMVVDKVNKILIYAGAHNFVPDDIKIIGKFAFAKNKLIYNINIPRGVTRIGVSAFSDCTNLSSVSIPNTVTDIGSNAFSNCVNLRSITIPSSVVSIGVSAFSGCTSLKNVYFNTTTGWSSSCFSSTSLYDSYTAANYLSGKYSYCSWKRN